MPFEAQEKVDKKPPKIPKITLTPKQRGNLLTGKIPEAREDLSRFVEKYNLLEKNYPEAFKNIAKKYPSLKPSMENLAYLVKYFSSKNKQLTDSDLISIVDQYNAYARLVNQMLIRMENEQAENRGKEVLAAFDLKVVEETFTQKQKKEIRAFAKDLWDELFPETNVEKFVKWASGNQNLKDYQRILISPAEGIEAVVGGFVDLFKAKTYRDLFSSIRTISGMDYKDWCATWQFMKMTYEQLSSTDLIAPAISLIVALTTICGGASKISKLIKNLNYSKQIKGILEGVIGARSIAYNLPTAQTLPLGVIGGISLKYIDWRK